MSAERTATCRWEGDLIHGSGVLDGQSGALSQLPVTWASRTGRSDGQTSPEELLAAAHASCFSMALTHGLSEAGTPAEWLEVSATVLLEESDGAPTVTSSEIDVTGLVPGLDAIGFIQAATAAGKNCPISRALNSLEISVQATLDKPPPSAEFEPEAEAQPGEGEGEGEAEAAGAAPQNGATAAE
jgi:osmotically inducible protein OsmC